ncbi:origin recognition complex subunit 5 isoform X2 [Gorilla gorilla gorilla]|uniref:origin recognition complex subunit 5 isoform X2 n=1 Tax=Gorilla gorilla gorilla TaxID=9595 RepID=UPI002445D95D|nr:origin recognition complex subunit 5 isoform X2 [Gorilla gorilla gorilla]
MPHLENVVLCRESQVSILQSLFGERHHFSFPSIFIYGHTASGKTYVTQTLLKTLELPHVFVNCVECFTLRLLLEQILNKLNHLSSSEDGCSTDITCETFNDFVRLFKQVTTAENLKDQTVYIVLDKAEYLRDMEANLLPGFLRLQELAVLNFPKYCEPVVKGEASERDTRKLWRNIEPHLKKAMQTVYLREISSSQWEKLQKDDTDPGQLKGLSAHTHVELPYYSKFILIAAYLASYNPARTDKRFFLKHHGKIKKTNFLKKHEKTSNHLLGPKPFPLDRLLAILYSIVDSRVAPTANIFSQITSLVTLQLLTLVGHDDQLDGPKYKCTVSLDFIRAIARTVNFDIIKYLYDFL